MKTKLDKNYGTLADQIMKAAEKSVNRTRTGQLIILMNETYDKYYICHLYGMSTKFYERIYDGVLEACFKRLLANCGVKDEETLEMLERKFKEVNS